ncbi:hypothetical protein BDZ45DRAFT_79369 [Acephala macrosclerotiorum]|nr:hypothetical protein BDZ45DRAFT_79369 [Acephala macrosclerotiorum]
MIPTNNTISGGNVNCLSWALGQCCSQYFYCGSASDYCGVECRVEFGICGVEQSSVVLLPSSGVYGTYPTSLESTSAADLWVSSLKTTLSMGPFSTRVSMGVSELLQTERGSLVKSEASRVFQARPIRQVINAIEFVAALPLLPQPSHPHYSPSPLPPPNQRPQTHQAPPPIQPFL